MKITNLYRRDVIRLDTDDQTYFTKEGYLIDHSVVTRIGIFEYHNPDGSVRKEFRPPEEVFSSDSLVSYVGKPVIVTHDAGYVTKDNVTDEEIGTILEPGYRDGDKVRAKIVIHDVDSMKESGLKELSLGYNLDIDNTPGEYQGEHYDAVQRNIRINHLALVAEARAGDSARLNIDGKDRDANSIKEGGRVMRHTRFDGEPMSPEDYMKGIKGLHQGKEDEDDAPQTPEEKIQMVRDRWDRRDGDEAPQSLEEATQKLDEQDKDIQTLLDSIDEIQAKNDITTSQEDEDDLEEDEDDEIPMNKDSVDKRIRERVAILWMADRLNLDGVENLSNLEIKKRVIKAVNPKVRLDGKSKGYINYAYQYAIENGVGRKDVSFQRAQMSGRLNHDSADQTGLTAAMAARKRMQESLNLATALLPELLPAMALRFRRPLQMCLRALWFTRLTNWLQIIPCPLQRVRPCPSSVSARCRHALMAM